MSDRDLDRLLVERVQRGDKQAFGLLVTKYQRKLARLVSRLIWNSSDVEDVVQESFIRAYRALPDFRNDSAFYTWLYRIGVNSAKDWLVSNRARISATSAVDIEDVENYEIAEHHRDNDTPEEVLMSKQIAATVNAAVADLPEDMRMAVSLREIDGLSYEEIAEAMNTPVGTVRSRIFRAREAIAIKLRPLVSAGADKRW
ncbi:MAG: RNA polymerase sigma factor RpoE [Rhodocyclaceae bacterium]|nr:RNA polymerase sigma factor RpoE [Rhodocyclaceae bacterium]MBK9623463.1 RNA polymerase sigma factor RpoE [Rhodocyclaceae bacterium]MBL0076043.1 RNA polymerase sigma factor RpoE [Rhodocyclaceae bacterium]MBP6108378.1 RNA polymerase sigma factor RpoE [Rhodocyclaceae bacterium]MBP6278394.1 RNA polymerase sigma factor RpoE [Rhodocyclaceae bacterium]